MDQLISLQSIFDTAWQAFITENSQPGTEKTGQRYICTYLSNEGRRCAIGLSLPDNVAEISNEVFSAVVFEYPDLFDDSVHRLSDSEMDRFQSRLHDDLIDSDTGLWSASLPERAKCYIETAVDFGLQLPEGS